MTTNLQRKFGLQQQQYDEMFQQQEGRCAICNWQWHLPCRKLAVDHSHRTGVIRGLLCWWCNRGLGLFKDHPASLLKASQYLQVDWAKRGWVIPVRKRRKKRGK